VYIHCEESLGEMVREGSGVFMLRSLSSACFICGYGNTFDGLATNSISLLATCFRLRNVDGQRNLNTGTKMVAYIVVPATYVIS